MSTPTRLRHCRVAATRLPRWILAGSIAPLLALSAAAQSLTWDSNPGLVGIQTDNGDWDGGNFWFNGTTNGPWVSGAQAIFTGAQTVDAAGIVVDDISFTVAGGSPILEQGATLGSLTLGGGDGTHSINISVSGTQVQITLPLAGTQGLRKDGAGSLTIAGTNTYTGQTLVNAGVLNLLGGSSLPDTDAVTVAAGAELRLSGGAEAIGALNGAGTVRSIGSGSPPWILTVGMGGGSGSFSGTLQVSAGLEKVGAGTQVLAGLYPGLGAVTVRGGFLELGGVGAIPDTSVVTVAAGATLRLLASKTLLLSQTGTGTVDLAGASVLTFSTSGINNVLYNGTITGTGGLALRQSGSVTLQGMNSFTGGVTISAGTMWVGTVGDTGVNSPLGADGPITLGGFSSTGTLAYSGGVGEASTNRSFGFVAAGANLWVPMSGATLTLTGIVSGPGALTKFGPGMLALTNAANTFSGNVTIEAGTLAVTDVADVGQNSALGTGGHLILDRAVFLFNGAGNDATNRTVSIVESDSSIDVASGSGLSLTGVVSGSSLSKGGVGTLTLSGANTYGPATNVRRGTLAVAGGNAIPDTSVVNVDSGGMADPAVFQLLASETIGGLAGTGTVDLGVNTLTVSVNLGGNGYAYSGAITGSGRLVKLGNSVMILTGVSDFTGGVTVAGSGSAISINALGNIGTPGPLGVSGVITLGDDTNSGRLTYVGSGTASTNREINIRAGGGVIRTDGSGVLSLAGPITGGQSMLKLGLGQLQIVGDKVAVGSTTITEGTLRLAGSMPNSNVIVSSGRLEGSSHRTIGALTLAGGIVDPGLAGNPSTLSTTGGTTTFTSGTLALNLDSATAYDRINVVGGVVFDGFVKLVLTLAYDPDDDVDVLRIVMNDGSDPTTLNDANARFVYGFDNVLEDGEIVLVSSGVFSQQFEFRYGLTAADNDVRLIAIPEPSAALLAAGQLLMLGLFARRRVR